MNNKNHKILKLQEIKLIKSTQKKYIDLHFLHNNFSFFKKNS